MTKHRWSGLALLGWVGAFAVACGDDDGAKTHESSGGKSSTGSGGRGGATSTGGSDTTGGRVPTSGGSTAAAGDAGAPGSAGDGDGGTAPAPTGGRDSGGSTASGGSNDGGAPLDAGSGGGGTASGGSATGGAAPVGGTSSQGAHIPDVAPVQTGEVFSGDAVEGLEITHSHYYVHGSPQTITNHYWLSTVVNESDELKCQLLVSASIEAPGSAPVKFGGPVVAPMYRFEGKTSRVYCLAPGERGVAVTQPFEIAPQFDAEDITAVRYGISGGTGGADIVPAEWVRITNVEVEDEGATSRVTGDIETGADASVRGITAVVFPRNAAGTPLFYFRVSDERITAPEGTNFHFETPFYGGNFEDADVFYEHGAPSAP